MTRWPSGACCSVTPGPRSATTPHGSWPVTNDDWPSWYGRRSLPHMPEARMATTTSPGPGRGSGNSRSSSLRSPRNTRPRMRSSLPRLMSRGARRPRTSARPRRGRARRPARGGRRRPLRHRRRGDSDRACACPAGGRLASRTPRSRAPGWRCTFRSPAPCSMRLERRPRTCAPSSPAARARGVDPPRVTGCRTRGPPCSSTSARFAPTRTSAARYTRADPGRSPAIQPPAEMPASADWLAPCGPAACPSARALRREEAAGAGRRAHRSTAGRRFPSCAHEWAPAGPPPGPPGTPPECTSRTDSGHCQIVHAEQHPIVGPDLLHAPPRGGRQLRKLMNVVLVGALGPDALAAIESDARLADMHHLFGETDQMHLDASEHRVVEGVVPELVEREIRPQLAVQPPQDVEVERRGDAKRVVVRAVEHQRVLFEVHPDQQTAVRSTHVGDAGQETPRVLRNEVADGRAGVVGDAAYGLTEEVRQFEWGRVVGAHRFNPQPRIRVGQLVGRTLMLLARAVDRHVSSGSLQVIQEDARLGAAAAAILDEQYVGAEQRGDVGAGLAHDARLGARGVVLIELRDLLEQVRAHLVVEQLARQLFLRTPQAAQDLLQGRRLIRREVVK